MPPHPHRRAYPPVDISFYARSVVDVARDLLGMQLLRQSADGLCRGRIVETEAYLGAHDSACHASRGKSHKNATMFGEPGHSYIYAIHSRWCLNVVTEPEITPSAVLIRAVEPLEGQALMEARRGTDKPLDLARGPGRLCEAFDIDRAFDGWDLTRGTELWIARDVDPTPATEVITTLPEIAVSPRIGVTSAHDLMLRFFVRGNRFVSGPRYLHHS